MSASGSEAALFSVPFPVPLPNLSSKSLSDDGRAAGFRFLASVVEEYRQSRTTNASVKSLSSWDKYSTWIQTEAGISLLTRSIGWDDHSVKHSVKQPRNRYRGTMTKKSLAEKGLLLFAHAESVSCDAEFRTEFKVWILEALAHFDRQHYSIHYSPLPQEKLGASQKYLGSSVEGRKDSGSSSNLAAVADSNETGYDSGTPTLGGHCPSPSSSQDLSLIQPAQVPGPISPPHVAEDSLLVNPFAYFGKRKTRRLSPCLELELFSAPFPVLLPSPHDGLTRESLVEVKVSGRDVLEKLLMEYRATEAEAVFAPENAHMEEPADPSFFGWILTEPGLAAFACSLNMEEWAVPPAKDGICQRSGAELGTLFLNLLVLLAGRVPDMKLPASVCDWVKHGIFHFDQQLRLCCGSYSNDKRATLPDARGVVRTRFYNLPTSIFVRSKLDCDNADNNIRDANLHVESITSSSASSQSDDTSRQSSTTSWSPGSVVKRRSNTGSADGQRGRSFNNSARYTPGKPYGFTEIMANILADTPIRKDSPRTMAKRKALVLEQEKFLDDMVVRGTLTFDRSRLQRLPFTFIDGHQGWLEDFLKGEVAAKAYRPSRRLM